MTEILVSFTWGYTSAGRRPLRKGRLEEGEDVADISHYQNTQLLILLRLHINQSHQNSYAEHGD
jgi:hypothetical protein